MLKIPGTTLNFACCLKRVTYKDNYYNNSRDRVYSIQGFSMIEIYAL